jgi:di/tripeptidase
VTTVGRREAGVIPTDHPLSEAAARALQAVDADIVWGSGSTDANVPLSRGIPAICIGITQGWNAHRLDDYIDVTDIPRGMEALARLVWSISTSGSVPG